jgi:NAD(P)-dependent dehydrogenase (short-subunit alcohol dehydrogenase family)
VTSIKKLSSLKGRRALITGAAGGLGKVMADTLAELGASLVLIDLESTEFSAMSKVLEQQWGIKTECYICDLEQQMQRTKLIEKLINDGYELNILINNAAFVGTSDLEGWVTPFETQTTDTWRRALEVNLTAAFDLCKGLTPLLKISEGSSIINIASIYGLYGPDWSLYEGTAMGNPAAYAVSKGGLIQFGRWMATTLAPHIRVNTISPGGIFRNQPQDFVRRYEEKTPMGRMASEDDFRGTVAYLASDLSKYVTGQNLIVDGGWGIW